MSISNMSTYELELLLELSYDFKTLYDDSKYSYVECK